MDVKREDKNGEKTSLFIVIVFLLVFAGVVSADTLFLGPDSFQKDEKDEKPKRGRTVKSCFLSVT